MISEVFSALVLCCFPKAWIVLLLLTTSQAKIAQKGDGVTRQIYYNTQIFHLSKSYFGQPWKIKLHFKLKYVTCSHDTMLLVTPPHTTPPWVLKYFPKNLM